MLNQSEVSKQKVLVLMATYNGLAWLPEQVSSILSQNDIEVELVVSDDRSDDGSAAWLREYADKDSRVKLLSSDKRYGAPGKNFYRLLLEADVAGCDYIALADQDDVWLTNKLKYQVDFLQSQQADGVSSNVVAFWPNGHRFLVNKSQDQRKLDYLFESAGPGCSFLFTTDLLLKIRAVLQTPELNASSVELHDWLIYAVCRASGGVWRIDSRPTLKYRQHGSNVLGVNFGVSAWKNRLLWVMNGWYRTEVTKLSRVVQQLSKDAYVQTACQVILEARVIQNFKLLRYVSQSRRNLTDRLFLGLMMFFRIF